MAAWRRAIVGSLGLVVGLGFLSATARAQYQGQTLTVASFGGAVDKALQKAMAGFEEKFGVTVRWVPGNVSEVTAKVLATRANPEFDLVMIDNVGRDGLSAAGALTKLDPAIMTNLPDLLPQAKLASNDGVAVGFNLTGFFYNPVEFQKQGWAPPHSWNDIFRPEFCHRIGFTGPGVSYIFNVLAMLSGGDINNMQVGIDKFLKLKGCIDTLEVGGAKLEEKIQLGEYVVGIHGSVRVVPLALAGYPVKFVMPDEGTPLAFTSAAPIAGTSREKLAQEFINWLISPKAQTILMNESQYVPVNTKVAVPEELKKLGIPGQDVIERSKTLDSAVVTAQRQKWGRELERGLAR